MYEFIGIIGAALILGAWVMETKESVKKHKALIDLQFSVLALAGNVALAIYSYFMNIPIYFWLNGCIALVIVFEIIYSIHIKKIHKRKKR
jgi:lipid-A-disaccharide synthase-like uncharacterized protein